MPKEIRGTIYECECERKCGQKGTPFVNLGGLCTAGHPFQTTREEECAEHEEAHRALIEREASDKNK